MDNKILIFGHKNPDTDSVSAAISLSYLKNNLGENTEAFILDEVNQETAFVLEYFNTDAPEILNNVRIQLKDLSYDKNGLPFTFRDSILDAYTYMNLNKIRTLPIVSDEKVLRGLITMKDIAMSLVQEDQRKLHTSFDNVINGLEGEEICKFDDCIDGNIIVIAFHLDTVEEMQLFQEDSIIIVGDRFDIIRAALEKKVELIIITGNVNLPDDLSELAKENKVNIIRTNYDTYRTSKVIYLTNYACNIMISENILQFKEDEYLDECKEVIQESQHSKFPIISKEGQYLGILGRGHVISPGKKKVILVDHNEYSQSALGIDQAEILEVIDHHKIGDISTSIPINFRNSPVGSTNTIIYQMYMENGVDIPYEIAGLMLSGIISDTLLLKSPTTTSLDTYAVGELTKKISIDLTKYAMEMFRRGTDISGRDVEDVFYSDYKEFSLEGTKIGISQVFTLNIEAIKKNIYQYLKLIEEINRQKDQFITLLLVTDIIKQGSYVFYNESKDRVIENAFKRDMEQGTFIEDCVSRKKQVIPMLIQGIHQSKS
ncbi:putative manganese-dependent inorganic diphosphatase [Alkalibaculum sp. M08DMB]|uniref:inorganic diphosphatase n=1 Tax=Alkalibaculum sporogenes TaxID=2655001 RepID=A0A6A7K544_9FIRM|nr:putative manganese-dependent inorganic diphosphatase [Alkalibaculum sporogenes]MPW24500.1 putative manganese-dependent inorganic diphosphatase [Alkalibaculum sporogenes]